MLLSYRVLALSKASRLELRYTSYSADPRGHHKETRGYTELERRAKGSVQHQILLSVPGMSVKLREQRRCPTHSDQIAT
jgi:hypothetical protein